MNTFNKTLLLALLFLFQFAQCYRHVVIGYYTDWNGGTFKPEDIDFSKHTHINYSFGLLQSNYTIQLESKDLLKRVVELAHENRVKVLISVGGWTGSKYFSSMAASQENRNKFIEELKYLMNRFELDGIDLDWEYPGRQGDSGNQVDKVNDTSNFLIFLKELRLSIGDKLMTAAVSTQPFDGPSGPLDNVAPFASLFDWINLMTYDIHGPWSETTGPESGLDFQIGKGNQHSITQAVEQWLRAGFLGHQLVVGIPFYGYRAKTVEAMTFDNQYVKVVPNTGSNPSFKSLYQDQILLPNHSVNKLLGWEKHFDYVTQTPWLYHNTTQSFISYDDPQAIKQKAEYVRCKGLRGLMYWSMDQDYQGHLIKAMQRVKRRRRFTTCKKDY